MAGYSAYYILIRFVHRSMIQPSELQLDFALVYHYSHLTYISTDDELAVHSLIKLQEAPGLPHVSWCCE